LIHVCPTTSDGEALLKFTAENGWEGIVIKEKDGYYHFGTKHPTWRKFKHVRELVATVLGLACKGGRVHSLLLGIRNGEKWSWIGKAATGLNQKALTLLDEWSRQAVCSAPALDRFPQLKEEVIWVKPVLKVKVQFMEWTPEGTLRAPVIKGFVT
jgi:bifunctional non-homologous end joining protein LigD